MFGSVSECFRVFLIPFFGSFLKVLGMCYLSSVSLCRMPGTPWYGQGDGAASVHSVGSYTATDRYIHSTHTIHPQIEHRIENSSYIVKFFKMLLPKDNKRFFLESSFLLTMSLNIIFSSVAVCLNCKNHYLLAELRNTDSNLS